MFIPTMVYPGVNVWWLTGFFPLSKNKSIFILNFQLVILVYGNVFVANYNCLKSNCLRECVASFYSFSHAI